MRVIIVLLVAWCLWLHLGVLRLDDAVSELSRKHNVLVSIMTKHLTGGYHESI